jgi:uncharacterized protein involved in exopolysaccharide biosynthesis
MSSRRPRRVSEYLRAARPRKGFVIMTALVFAAAAWLALKRQPYLYEAATLLAGESKSDQANETGRRLAAIQQQLTSRARLEALVEKPGLFDETTAGGASPADLVTEMQSNVRVSECGNDCLRISYRAGDPSAAARIANRLAQEIVASNTKPALSSSSAEAEALRQRAIELSARLRELEERSPGLLALCRPPKPCAPNN